MQSQLAERLLEPGTPEYGKAVAGYNLAARHRAVAVTAVEIRPLGGVAGRPPVIPNAVGGRDGVALVNAIAAPDPAMFEVAAEAARSVFGRLGPWSIGRSLLNFDPLASATCWDGETLSRLDAIRSRSTDPGPAKQDA